MAQKTPALTILRHPVATVALELDCTGEVEEFQGQLFPRGIGILGEILILRRPFR